LLASLVGGVTLVTGAMVKVALKTPMEQLPPLRADAVKSNFERPGFLAVVILIIIAATVTFHAISSHFASAPETLTQAEFLNKVQAQQIAHGTITINPESSLRRVTGTYYKTNEGGKITEKAVPFAATIFVTPEKLDDLLRKNVELRASEEPTVLLNFVPIVVLGSGLLVIVSIVGLLIYLARRSRRGNGSKGG
jgi:hypothetical protein